MAKEDGRESSKRRRRGKSSGPPSHITFRVTPEEYADLATQADERMTVSELVKTRVFGGGVRDTTVLRHIAALNCSGQALRILADGSGASKLEAAALLVKVRADIERLARQLP